MKDDFTTPVEWDEDGKPTLFRWDSDRWFDSLPPNQQRNYTRQRKVRNIIWDMYRTIPWMKWPVLSYIYAFWQNIFEDGIKSTCMPRWGAVTFGWLNDGMKPTLWHTWRQLTHDHTDRYCGIYPEGAPNSFKQAEEWEEMWAEKRRQKEILDEGIFQ